MKESSDGFPSVETLVRPTTLRDFQKMFGRVYGRKNPEWYTPENHRQRLLEEAVKIIEPARKDKREELPRHLINLFSWTCGVANRFEIDLQDALWTKYPGICSYCLREKSCICETEHPKIPDKAVILRRRRMERAGREPVTLEEHRLLHHRLYGGQNNGRLVLVIASRLIEEAGEVCEALRFNNHKEASDEMADLLSWEFGLATKLGLVPFDQHVWEAYPHECNECHTLECVCDRVI